MSTPDEIHVQIEQVLANEIGPALELDGTQIEVLEFDRGVVSLRLNGVCTG